jgi:hypothetical protein
MKIRLRALTLLFFSMALMLTSTASPNGINPPRPKEASTTTAFCHERSGRRQHEILRARITNGDKSKELLTLRIGGASEQLPIADMESVALNTTSADRNGFTTGTLIRRGDSREESVAVQIRSNGSAYRLAGFTRTGSQINIELGKCGRIEFSNSAGAADRHGPGQKKLAKD